MNIETLTSFFGWCTIINGGVLTLWVGFYMAAPDLTYRTQRKFFPVARENFDLIFYALLGLFKVVFIFFNLVPWIVLSIIGAG